MLSETNATGQVVRYTYDGLGRLATRDAGGMYRYHYDEPRPGASAVGNQAGGRVFLFLETDDFWRDYAAMNAADVQFVRPPSAQSYGTVAVF